MSNTTVEGSVFHRTCNFRLAAAATAQNFWMGVDRFGNMAPHRGDSGRSVVPHRGVHSRWALLWGNSDLPWRRLTLA